MSDIDRPYLTDPDWNSEKEEVYLNKLLDRMNELKAEKDEILERATLRVKQSTEVPQ